MSDDYVDNDFYQPVGRFACLVEDGGAAVSAFKCINSLTTFIIKA
jgi:D-lyxose ketol-isomerase